MIEALYGSTTPLWAPRASGAFGFPPSAPLGSAMIMARSLGHQPPRAPLPRALRPRRR